MFNARILGGIISNIIDASENIPQNRWHIKYSALNDIPLDKEFAAYWEIGSIEIAKNVIEFMITKYPQIIQIRYEGGGDNDDKIIVKYLIFWIE